MWQSLFNCAVNSSPPPFTTCKSVGSLGEQACVRFLAARGIEILERNWSCRYGELDFVCRKDRELIVVEVKTRLDGEHARRHLFDNITRRKRRKLALLAQIYFEKYRRRCGFEALRVDVIGVLLCPKTGLPKELRHLEAALGSEER